ncbi:CDP-glycerol glycerophosphotransferase family protein [Mollicutes bacterium LVI A0039]|nr:CDP-glycerol glycerophosphotransferase family protein [Mollicutes bacterium LVI A0039]
MKYAFEEERCGYEKIDGHSKMNFNNDTLNFQSLIVAYRYLYYAKNNKFEIMITRDMLSERNLLRTLIMHGAQVKLYRKTSSLKFIVAHLFLLLYVAHAKYVLPKVTFCPALEKVKGNRKPLYILDGYYINNFQWDYSCDNVHATYSTEGLPFEYSIKESNSEIDWITDNQLINANAETFKYCICEDKIYKSFFRPKAYIYSAEPFDGGVIISIFLQGYEHTKEKFVIESSSEYEVLANDDWQYYSKRAAYFKDNFIKLKMYSVDASVKFKYVGQETQILFTRNITANTIIADLYFQNHAESFSFSSEIEQFKNDFYQQIELKQKECQKEIYLFHDRQDVADDNAEALYKYYMENTDKQIYFAVAKGTPSWHRLEQLGFNLVDFGSKKHKEIYLLASKLITSHAARRIYDPFFPNREYVNLEKFKFVFLQHGIIMGSHHGFLDKVNNKIDLLVTSTDEESELVKSFSGFTNVPAVGLARYDNYKNTDEKTGKFITYAPSWNVNYKMDLENSVYVREIEHVLNSEKIHKLLLDAKIDLYLIFHPEFIKENIKLNNPFNYKILKSDEILYSEVLSETIGLITDYSSLFFDVLYQNKFVVHHQPYELHHENDELSGYQDAIFESFNIEELEAIFTSLASKGFKNDDEKNKVIRKFFKYYDNKQCQRTYLEIEKL